MCNFGKFNETLPNKTNFIVHWVVKELVEKSNKMSLKFEINLKWSQWKYITIFT